MQWSRPSVCLSVCLSVAAFAHYCMDPDASWGNGRGCPRQAKLCHPSLTRTNLSVYRNEYRTHYKLHWLPVRQSVEFKLACLVHQSLAEQTPSYLASDIQLTTNTGRPQLRSASERICVVPRTHYSFGVRSFSAAGPRVWNALPSYLRQDMNYNHFKHALKGHNV